MIVAVVFSLPNNFTGDVVFNSVNELSFLNEQDSDQTEVVEHHSQPTKMSLQGKATDSGGSPVIDGDLQVKVSTENSCLIGVFFDHTYTDIIQNGIFDLTLGDTYTLNLDFNDDYYMCLYVNTELVSGPSVFRGGQGEVHLDDVSHDLVDFFVNVSGDVMTGNLNMNDNSILYPNGTSQFDGITLYIDSANDKIGVGLTSPTRKLDVNGTIRTASYYDVYDISTSNILGYLGKGSSLIGAGVNDNAVVLRFENELEISKGSSRRAIFAWNYFSPVNDKGMDLGISGTVWDDIYFDDLYNEGSAAFTDRNVTEEIIDYPPKEKEQDTYHYKNDKGLVELDPTSLPDALYDTDENTSISSILTDEVVIYNYKANYEQQLQINELEKQIEDLKEALCAYHPEDNLCK
ncbi:MAG: hypothetical protein ABIF08_03575 [Nanoarchaeota archaeon]